MEDYRHYTDPDGNNYELLPQPEYKSGDRACVGCHFPIGNGEACRKAKTCTPKSDFKSGMVPLLKGAHVWVLIK